VEPSAALADLAEISSQVETAAIFGDDGPALASTFADDALAERLVGAARALLAAADELPSSAGRKLTHVEVALREGSVFVVRDGDRALAATTTPDPTAGLVLYDLRACLRAAAPEPAAAPRRRPKRTADA
jgi:predicted regulator of Ras-like GTPase activity (Roadblock/LC7/MglB family)